MPPAKKSKVSHTYSPKKKARTYYKNAAAKRPYKKRRVNKGLVRQKDIKAALFDGAATGAGLVAIRTLSNMLLKNYTGHMRAGADAGVGLVLYVILNALGAPARIVAASLTGGFTSAAIREIEMFAPPQYIQMGEYMVQIPQNQLDTAAAAIGAYYQRPIGAASGVGDFYPDYSLDVPENVPIGELPVSPYA